MNVKKTYTLLKINIKDIHKSNYDLKLSYDDEKSCQVKQQDSPLLRQLNILRGCERERVNELIIVEAKHTPKNLELLAVLINEGFLYNGRRFVRFGKSSSQAKDGMTVFVDQSYYAGLMERSQLGVPVRQCVIPKYESYRCLIFSSCQFVETEKLPYIVMVDEYKKILPAQHVRYASIQDKEYTNPATGETNVYKNQKRIEEGYHDVGLSPFDGFGVHTKEVSEAFSRALGLDYTPAGYQIRLPFLKGMSVEAPIRDFYREQGITHVQDIFGESHPVEKIDCIWNVSMWKAYGIFKEGFGEKAWKTYLERLQTYGYQIGLSKFTHHTKDIPVYAKLNFQYLQCLDLNNPAYSRQFKQPDKDYDILDENNHGKIIKLSRYTTDLFEKIIKGNKFYTLKFLGIHDTDTNSLTSKYIQAVLINDRMLTDPPFRNLLKRKLNKAITQMKYGKIYTEGFYHIIVGDIIGYLEYCAGLDVKGCLDAGQFYAPSLPDGECLSFRSPLVDPSEVNKVRLVRNEITNKYLKYFKDQDLCMINLHDLTLPQQGGADEDGDSFFLTTNEILIGSKIDKPIVIDMDDKQAVTPVDYNAENILHYECNSRDNRIGEITNIATAILNQVTEDEGSRKRNEDNISLLRLYQGKEIDFIKTGYRWTLSKQLRTYMKKIPFFLLYNYPKKLEVYNKIREANKSAGDEDKIPLNAFRSPSALNELCDYATQWERKNLIWDRTAGSNGDLLIDHELTLTDRELMRQIKRLLNRFKTDLRNAIAEEEDLGRMMEAYQEDIRKIPVEERLLANYFIKVSYRTVMEDKILCWSVFGDIMLENLKRNTPGGRRSTILKADFTEEGAYEFLGKYYKLIEE
ncbi:hypothetical protein YDYSY3_04460 [Paenibacillus chitinolyticus]|uniref:RNA dependent RNA polymerase n=1 Tax=Paenibacillus chitinolyticus TaxID=79263 RepID=UPI0026E4BE51|nr:hypothetical protein [Paenibacillus chitinolyticus]GKS09446.1 hypothetical protein YDYSY3_04460 [Paenibacillus chitinolyticus]